ncbi:unnamed protein product, partial [Protopolystoma xenopodis]
KVDVQLSRCTCCTRVHLQRLEEGRYKLGSRIYYLRRFRSHVMVRVGGGWLTLSEFLDRYDPCRKRKFFNSLPPANFTNITGTTNTGSNVRDLANSENGAKFIESNYSSALYSATSSGIASPHRTSMTNLFPPAPHLSSSSVSSTASIFPSELPASGSTSALLSRLQHTHPFGSGMGIAQSCHLAPQAPLLQRASFSSSSNEARVRLS